MTMVRLLVGNFDFEHRLAVSARGRLPKRLERLNAEMATVWMAAADAGDYLWTPQPIPASVFEQWAGSGLPQVVPVANENAVPSAVELCPWGWNQPMFDWACRQGWSVDAPRIDIIRRVNSRQFSASLEREWCVEPAGACAIHQVDELDRAIQSSAANQLCETNWVLKAQYGMSARERVLGSGTRMLPSTLNWIRKRLQADGIVFFEPWLDRTQEMGLQFTIPRHGAPDLVGITPLLTDSGGEYQGSRILTSAGNHGLDEESAHRWSSAIKVAHRAAARVQQEGYFGPLGIDAISYRGTDGAMHFRPLQDLNARYTMGRLALGFRRLLKHQQVASWLHIRWSCEAGQSPQEWLERQQAKLPSRVRLLATSPHSIAGQPTQHGTTLVIADSPEEIEVAERLLLAKTARSATTDP